MTNVSATPDTDLDEPNNEDHAFVAEVLASPGLGPERLAAIKARVAKRLAEAAQQGKTSERADLGDG